ncbi:MAG: FtsX-like permease family protein [Planctomycetales bacterium]|nr:FtsX-like permease family protein [Planctomycetales bacterium]
MYKLLLCQRYLRTRYIALASIISVTLGVATMIVVNSVMAGFSSEMRDRIQGILSDIIIETRSFDGEPDAATHQAVVHKLAGRYISGVTATVEVFGMLSFQYGGQYIHHPVTLVGIDPRSKSSVGPLVDYLQSYHDQPQGPESILAERSKSQKPDWELTPSAAAHRKHIADLNSQRLKFMKELQHQKREETAIADPDPFVTESDASVETAASANDVPQDGRVYIGAGLISFPQKDQETNTMRTVSMVQPGDDVKISTVTAGTPEAAYFSATVVDVFQSGMSEYDSQLVYCNIETLQKVRKMVRSNPDGSSSRAITSIQIKLKDYHDASKVVELLRSEFPPETYNVLTWEQKQGTLLAAVEVESSILNILLFLIIAVAGFGILAIFFMIVVEKTRDIGILKALGASSAGVMSIFLSYGLSLGMVGSGVGVAFGLLFVRYINQIESVIALITGRKVFDEKIYYFKEIPTHVDPWTVCWVAIGAMTIAVVASILPARRAAQLQPVRALRHE